MLLKDWPGMTAGQACDGRADDKKRSMIYRFAALASG